MLVTKREGYAIKNENEINLRAEASSQQQTSAAETNQEIVINPDQAKAATDFAIVKRNEGQLQASLLKDQLFEQKDKAELWLHINPLKETPAGLPADAASFNANNLAGRDLHLLFAPCQHELQSQKSPEYAFPIKYVLDPVLCIDI